MNGELIDAKSGLQLYKLQYKTSKGKKSQIKYKYALKCTASGCVYNLGNSKRLAEKKFKNLDHKSLSDPFSNVKPIDRKKTMSFEVEKPVTKKKTTTKKKSAIKKKSNKKV